MNIYRMTVDDEGNAIVTDPFGTVLPYREFEALLRALNKVRREYQTHYLEQVNSLNDFQALFPNSRLEYPFDHQWAIHVPYSGQRPKNAPVFGGVYVISTQEYPDIIKIGRTKDLYLRSFEWGGAKSPFTGNRDVRYVPVAFIHTPLQVDVERYLHLRFDEFRHPGNEWFTREPVQDWLLKLSRNTGGI